MARQFVKVARDIYRDPKLRFLRPEQKWVWVAMLCVAHEAVEWGVITDSMDELAYRMDVGEDLLAETMDTLLSMDRPPIIRREDGAIVITNWEDHQLKSPSDAPDRVRERVYKHRQKAKSEHEKDVTGGNDCNDVTVVTKSVTGVTALEEKRREETNTPLAPLAGGAPADSPEPKRKRKATPKSAAPDSLGSEESARLKDWRDREYPWLSDAVLISHAQQCLDWFGGKAEERADWVRTCQTWIRKDVDDGKIAGTSPNGSGAGESDGSAEVPFMTPAQCEEAQRQRKAEREAQLVRLYGKNAVAQTKAVYS